MKVPRMTDSEIQHFKRKSEYYAELSRITGIKTPTQENVRACLFCVPEKDRNWLINNCAEWWLFPKKHQ